MPRKWAEKYKIKKGDELEVEISGGSVIVRTDNDMPSGKVEIDFKNRDIELIYKILSSLYKAGYDEIKILYENPHELSIIQSTIDQELIGFEIIEQGRGYLIVKQISNINYSEFEAMLRRTFTFLISTADECLDALKTNNITLLRNIVINDKTINKLTDYCRRSQNKKEGYFRRTGPGYTIVELLEKVGDSYKDICRYCSQSKVTISRPIIDALEEINNYLKEIFRLFYEFNLKEMERLLRKKDTLRNLVVSLSTSSNKKEVPILLYMNSLLKDIAYLNGPMMTNAV